MPTRQGHVHIVSSQVKAMIESRAQDNGRKRHIAVDAMGLLLAVVITAASVQDRDAARPLLWNLHRTSRRIRLIWADAVYAGKLTNWAASMKMTLQIITRRNPHAFEVLPRRWVVERTFAWISKHRRTVRDYERLPASHEAMILWAMTALMACRLAQPAHLSNTHLACRLTCLAEALAGFANLVIRVRRVAARERGLRVIMCVRQRTCDHHEGRDEQLARRRFTCRVPGRPVAVPDGLPRLPDRPGG